MNETEKNGCAVLAGGAGRRMGQVNKAELMHGGRTFLEHICSEFERTGLTGYISVANYEQKVPVGWTAVKDYVTGPNGDFIGPIGGIYSCLLQAEKDGLEGIFFAPCDAPMFSGDIIKLLRDEIESCPECDAAVLRTNDGRVQTTFGWYSVRSMPCLEDQIKNERYSLNEALGKMKTLVISSDAAKMDDSLLTNINYIDDYHCIQE